MMHSQFMLKTILFVLIAGLAGMGCSATHEITSYNKSQKTEEISEASKEQVVRISMESEREEKGRYLNFTADSLTWNRVPSGEQVTEDIDKIYFIELTDSAKGIRRGALLGAGILSSYFLYNSGNLGGSLVLGVLPGGAVGAFIGLYTGFTETYEFRLSEVSHTDDH